jgi:hypothetical protein
MMNAVGKYSWPNLFFCFYENWQYFKSGQMKWKRRERVCFPIIPY